MKKNRFALFLGCTIPARVKQFGFSARVVLDKLKIDIVEIGEFNCCGYPMRNADFETFILFSARNLALAEKQGLDIMALCMCCFNSLKKAHHVLIENRSLRQEINTLLKKENLAFNGDRKVTHFLSVLYHDVGPEKIKKNVTHPFKDLKIAMHHGCHALRPSDIMQFDDPVEPVLFDTLVKTTGAQSIDWPLKLECCGAPLLGVNDDLSMDLTEKKLINGKEAGADYICVACPWCHLQFDSVQQMLNRLRNKDHHLPSILYPQLLGISMGIRGSLLGIKMNSIDISGIEALLS
ncbi:MAG: CoB--CoM heterodisulfide reductase iron-sulfur subunit B family protein [Desulfobacterales bacterium]